MDGVMHLSTLQIVSSAGVGALARHFCNAVAASELSVKAPEGWESTTPDHLMMKESNIKIKHIPKQLPLPFGPC